MVEAASELFSVRNEIIIITGVCGQLGSHYAHRLLTLGARVVGLDLESRPNAEELARSYPDRFFFIPTDITRGLELEVALSQIKNIFGSPTVLINNAAIDSPPNAPLTETGPFETYPDESWEQIMSVNLTGVYKTCKIFGAAMAENGYGSIINVSSIYGIVSPDQSIYDYRRKRGEEFFKPIAYAASKSGIINMSRYLGVYWGKKSIRVNTLVLAGVQNNQDPEFLQAYCSRIPIGRMASPSDYEGAIVFLSSRASSYMTGAMLVVDGGWTAI